MNLADQRFQFQRHLAALDFVVLNISRSVKVLRTLVGNPLSGITTQEQTTIRLALVHYVINNLDSLFHRRKGLNTLLNISQRFENSFPPSFFDEFDKAVEKFKARHRKDLERISRNRNLSTSHLGGEGETLGLDAEQAARLDALFGGQTPVAVKESLRFINASDLIQMQIILDLPLLEKMLEELRQASLMEEWKSGSQRV